jgi:hypothetical protein
MSPRLLTALAFLLTVLSARAEIEFSGFFTTNKEAHFALTDTESRTASGWLKLDQSFRDYTLAAFDAEKETLTLRRGGQSLVLPLRTAKVKAGKSTISGTISIANGEKIEGVHATLFLGEEATFPVRDGITLYLKAVVLPNGNYEYSSRFILRTPDGKEEMVAAPRVVVLPGHPFGIKVGDYGYSFKP